MKTLYVTQEKQQNTTRLWSFGMNTCHAALWLRDDLYAQMKCVHDELGVNYIRCHGFLNDDLNVVAPDGSFHFETVIRVLERIREAGFRPFLELSSMPGALARGTNSICHYHFRTDPPADWTRYEALIKALTLALTEHFGKKELDQWYFEVWNEPDISFWAGTQKEYFKMYDLARHAIKSVSASYKVGGPATSKTAWIDEFIQHTSTPSPEDPDSGTRCDFISTHAYPSDAAFLDAAFGDVVLQEARILRELYAAARKKIDIAWGADFPLFIGEWNSSAGPLVFNHDECNNAPFICKSMAEVQPFCKGSLYWNASDIYEEPGFHYEPFHGGYGLITVNDIRKSSWHAFRFLHELSGTQEKAAFDMPCEEHGALAFRDHSILRILVWNYQQPEKGGVPLDFHLSKEFPVCSGTMESVTPEHGSAYETWLKLGKPDFCNQTILSALSEASKTEVIPTSSESVFHIHPGTIVLLTFDRCN